MKQATSPATDRQVQAAWRQRRHDRQGWRPDNANQGTARDATSSDAFERLVGIATFLTTFCPYLSGWNLIIPESGHFSRHAVPILKVELVSL
jgi:hypothetical protein